MTDTELKLYLESPRKILVIDSPSSHMSALWEYVLSLSDEELKMAIGRMANPCMRMKSARHEKEMDHKICGVSYDTAIIDDPLKHDWSEVELMLDALITPEDLYPQLMDTLTFKLENYGKEIEYLDEKPGKNRSNPRAGWKGHNYP